MFFLLSLCILTGIILFLELLSFSISLGDRHLDKLDAYECGLEPILNARIKFHISYYIIGILYLIFDLEILFLFPLSLTLLDLPNFLSLSLLFLFLLLLTLSLLWEWFHGALETKLP